MPISSEAHALEAGAVRTRDLGKRYLSLEDEPRLLGLSRHPFRPSRYLWALRHLHLLLEPGESLGVIGANGSGKSTLLRVLAGVTAPSEGEVEAGGRVASLITVGAGFHSELTGRENIRVGGIVLGMTRREIGERFDDIVSFSGLAAALDRPVKHYSAGMFMRLGFSLAIFAAPDILLIDEVLAVGDAAFRERCYERVRALRVEGVTLILVSHSMAVVEQLCPRAVVLSRGEAVYDGPAAAAVERYHELLDAPVSGRPDTDFEVDAGAERVSGGATIDAVTVSTGSGDQPHVFTAGTRASIRCRIMFDRDVQGPRVAVAATGSGQTAYVLHLGEVSEHFAAGESLEVSVEVSLNLGPGTYHFVVAAREGTEDLLLVRARSTPFSIRRDDGDPAWWGTSDLRGTGHLRRA